ncbi:phosphotransferase [Streptomyces sp. SID3212]|uniref:phosphotransferase n=1 Tax=Streptomyces sp. SID3212 TaxID=2690259 RepID=UPI00136F4728|nr:phosphotransferase [Streptomyces sp. SID3212]MYV51356.1 phosphotransferase [Streptomyces sp. SID3212]
MRTGELLGTGRSADVYAYGEGWVLRRYRVGLDAGPEAVVMGHLREHGYPVPRVRPPRPEVPRELVMERLSGPTMLETLAHGGTTPEAAGAQLAGLLRRLHAVPARVGARPGDRVLHLDLHPDNVMLTPGGPVVIDWSNTEEGAPGLDLAMSALILAQVAVSDAPLADGAGAGLVALLRAAGPVADDAGEPFEDLLLDVRERRAANPTLSDAEREQLDEAVTLVRHRYDAVVPG